MDALWHLDLLGRLQVRPGDGGEALTRFRTLKAAALLAHLATHPGPQPRETLLALLWPDAPPDAARNSLSVALSSLRHQLEPPGLPPGAVFAADRQNIGLRDGAVRTDAVAFSAALRAARAADLPAAERARRLQSALELYRGPYLPGFYDDAILAQRDALADAFRQGVATLLPLLPAAEANAWLHRAAAADPDHAADYTLKNPSLAGGQGGMLAGGQEEAAPGEASPPRTQTLVALRPAPQTPPKHRGAALADDLFAFARAADGLAFAAACLRRPPTAAAVVTVEAARPPIDAVRRLLAKVADGHGVCNDAAAALARHELPPELRPTDLGRWRVGDDAERLHALPSASDGPPLTDARPAATAPLPLYPTRFFGRQLERERLTALLAEARLVTLTGAGGLGKTRLAIETLHALADQGAAVALVPLAHTVDGHQIPAAIAAALRLPTGGPGADERERVADALRESPTLLLLDNLEQFGDSAAEPVAWLLERAPGLRLLATSRRPLGAPGERLLPLAPLSTSAGGGPDALLQNSPAVALFCDRARAVLPDFALTERNAAAVAALCRRLDGIPLALELAASRARVLTPGQWLQRLESGLDAVAGTSRAGVPERHRTLLATLRWSYDLLPPDAQRFLPQLSVFRGGWSLDAAEAVADDPLALDHLAILCENSLVDSAPTDDGALRFTVLETVREFAASLPGADDPALAARHRAYFAERAAAHGQRLKTGAEPEALAWFAAEQENLRAALAAAPADALLPLAADVGRYWERRGAYAEAVRWLEEALAAHPGHDAARAVAHSILGNIAHNRGDFDRAEAEHRESLRLRESAGDDQGAAMALNNLSLIASLRQDFPAARALAERAIALHQRAGNALDAKIAQVNLANLHGYAGEWEEAERLYRDTVPTLRAHGNARALAVVYANLCVCAAQRGALDEAERWARDSVALKTETGDRFGLAESLDTLAQVLHARGADDEARACLDEQLRLVREMEAWRQLPVALLHRAQIDVAHPERSARLLGAARAQQRSLVGEFAPHEQGAIDALEAQLRAALGDSACDAALRHGERLERAETIALAVNL